MPRSSSIPVCVLLCACYAGGAGSVADESESGASGAATIGTESTGTATVSSSGDGSTVADATGSAETAADSDTGAAASPPTGLVAIASNGVIGLDWDALDGATGYRVHWSTRPGVAPGDGEVIEAAAPGIEHRGVTNGTTYYYVVTALVPAGESGPSDEASAVPGGEWVLEELGHGVVDDVLTGDPTAKMPIEQRLHVLLFAEGYTSGDLAIFHDHADHEGPRDNDVDGWVDLVFSIEPYSLFPEAFVVWYLPRPSNTTIRDANPDTAFAVPVDASGSFALTLSIPSDGETATRAWASVAEFPFAPTDVSGGGFGTLRKHTAAFLIFDPQQGHASVSGRALSLRNPADDSQRLSSAFGVGHAHEFTHAFSALRDEYMENDNDVPQYSATSNITPSAACGMLPWEHLLAGNGLHDTAELVGAFGDAARGFHPELLCLMNGTHDNAEYFGGDGLLRVEDRMCNFCREITAFRIFERAGQIESGDYADWEASFRAPFYDRFGFVVPDPVPQTNDVDDPASGMPIYLECTMSAWVPGPGLAAAPGAGAPGAECAGVEE